MTNYRNKYENFYLDTKGSYVPVGSVLPVLADVYSRISDLSNLDPGIGLRPSLQSPHYSYFGYLYCDGSLYNIRDYPGLYEIIGNNYMLPSDVKNGYSPPNASSGGSIQRSLFVGDDFYLVFSEDPSLTWNSKNPSNFFIKRPFPFNSVLKINNLGNFPSGLLATNQGYTLVAPTTSSVSISSTEYLYKVSGVSGAAVNKATFTKTWSSFGTYPTFTITKSYSLSDFPYVTGKFRVPDYRQRKLIGYSDDGISGPGSSTVESRSNATVGSRGGRWYIPAASIADPSFYVIGDIKTSGYSSITTTVSSNLIGSVKFKMGPVEDYVLVRPPAHSHALLNSEANESTEFSKTYVEVDKFSVGYTTINANIFEFVPGVSPASIRPTTAAGVSDATVDDQPLGHSHGIVGKRLTSTSVSTYGNTNGIGEYLVTGGELKYRSTETPAIALQGPLTYDSVTGFVSVNTVSAHGFVEGSVVTISGANEPGYNGTWSVSASSLSATLFKYVPSSSSLPSSSPSTGTVILRSANGFFETNLVQQAPKMWVVNNATVIGGKESLITDPDAFEVISTTSLTSAGSTTPSAPSVFSAVRVTLTSSGGGGANSLTNGTDGRDTTYSFTLDGILYGIKVTGGRGGTTAGQGGDRGDVYYQVGGGSWSTTIPASLVNNPKYIIDQSEYSRGTAGETPSQGTAQNAAGGTLTGLYGDGGDGASSFITNIVTNAPVTLTTDQTFTLPATTTAVIFELAGGGGADGRRDGTVSIDGNVYPSLDVYYALLKGCAASIVGGDGGGGAKLTGSYDVSKGKTLNFVVGQPGSKGGNLSVGSSYDVVGTTAGGGGEQIGGTGGPGAWQVAGSGGGGGGASGLRIPAIGPILGAGGGGGGGGSGGNPAGGDTCGSGGPGEIGSKYILTSNAAISFGQGGAGNYSGCTGGAGGGGGAGAGTTSSGGDPGDGGPAGTGHGTAGNGGKGGSMGGSAYNPNFWNGAPTLGIANNRNSSGYLKYTTTTDESYRGLNGGGGGAGALFSFFITGANLQSSFTGNTATVGNPGGGQSTGGSGTVQIEYSRTLAGEVLQTVVTIKSGQYYTCTQNGTPTAGPFNSTPLFSTSEPEELDVVFPGNGTGSTGKFAIPPTTTNVFPSWNGKITKYINFAGAGTRTLVCSSIDLSNANKIQFSVIVGKNNNGGEQPEQNLDLYYQVDGSSSAAFVGLIAPSTSDNTGWVTYDVVIPENSPLKTTNTSLILKQTRQLTDAANTDTYGLSSVTVFYDPSEVTSFVSSGGAFLPSNANNTGLDTGINEVRRTVGAIKSGITVSDGTFTLSSSTPISTTAVATPRSPLSLVTRYHKVKYLIKAF